MDEESRDQWMLIRTPPGVPWSGLTRYAAAMFFYQKGEMTSETLEIYRICSRIDDEDPLTALQHYKIGADWIARMNHTE